MDIAKPYLSSGKVNSLKSQAKMVGCKLAFKRIVNFP